MTLGQQPAELFELPPDAVVYDAACFQRGRLTCEPGPSGRVAAGAGPALTWSRVECGRRREHRVAGRPVRARGGGRQRPQVHGRRHLGVARRERSGFGLRRRPGVEGDRHLGRRHGRLGRDLRANVRPPGTPVTKSDFEGRVGAVGIGPAGIVARVHSGIDFDAFVTGVPGSRLGGPDQGVRVRRRGPPHRDRGRPIRGHRHGRPRPGTRRRRRPRLRLVQRRRRRRGRSSPTSPRTCPSIVGVADGFIARGESMWHSPDGMTWTEIGPVHGGVDAGLAGRGADRGPIRSAGPVDRCRSQDAAGPRDAVRARRSVSARSGWCPSGLPVCCSRTTGSNGACGRCPRRCTRPAAADVRRRSSVSDDAVLVLMWSGGEQPVPTLWRGTISS